MQECLICSNSLEEFLDLGIQPSANNLVSKDSLDIEEIFYHLKLGLCSSCFSVQTLERPKKEAMFKDNYAYFTSTSLPMLDHFKETAEKIKNRFYTKDFFIVEIGSNDGAFLKNFKEEKHLGIEPSLNVAEVARSKGIESWDVFFNSKSADKVLVEKGPANVIFAANVFGHVEEINSVVSGIEKLLGKDGVFVFEIYYLPKMMEKKSFDLIYDEHIFYYTLKNLNTLFQKFGLELFDVEEIPVHGGSIRGFTSRINSRKRSDRLMKMLENEEIKKVNSLETLANFSKDVKKIKTDLVDLISVLKKEGAKIAGYGATAKSTTVLNYCGIGKDIVEYIVDSTPYKQGKFSPGKKIPILSEDFFETDDTDYTILFAWNYADSIIKKQKAYSKRGGKWIVIHPEVSVI